MRYLFIFLLLFSTLNLWANTVKVHVPGMVCQMCVQGMKKSFKSAVENADRDVRVDLDTKTVTLKLKQKLSDEEIRERVKDAGYNVSKIEWM